MKPSTRRVLASLREGGERGRTTAELCQPDVGGVRFSARIQELRDAGHVISKCQVRQGSWRYWLRDEALEEAA